MDKDLEKQLERVRQLAARVDQIQERLAANSEQIQATVTDAAPSGDGSFEVRPTG